MTEISKAKALKKGTEREHASAWGPSPPVPGRNSFSASFSQMMVFSFELLSALLGGGMFHSFLVAYYYHAGRENMYLYCTPHMLRQSHLSRAIAQARLCLRPFIFLSTIVPCPLNLMVLHFVLSLIHP